MNFVGGFDAATCQTLMDTSEDMLVKCAALIKDMRDKAPAATINKGLERFLTGVLTHAGMHVGVLDGPLVGHQMARLLR